MKNVFNKNRETLLFYISNIEYRLKQGRMPIWYLLTCYVVFLTVLCKFNYVFACRLITWDATGTYKTQLF